MGPFLAVACWAGWLWLTIWAPGSRARAARRKARRLARERLAEPVPVVMIHRDLAGNTTILIPGSVTGEWDLHQLSQDDRDDDATAFATARQLAQLDHFDPTEWVGR